MAATADKVVPSVIVGGGRAGMALQEMGDGDDVLVKRGEPVPLDFGLHDLDAVLDSTPKSRWDEWNARAPHIDGITDTNPDGLTAGYGKVLEKGAFQKQMLEKLIWICAFMLVGAAILEKEYRNEVSDLIAELASAAAAEKGLVFDDEIEDRLCAYSRAVAHFPNAVEEFKWKNGWFYSLSEKAIARGERDPCSLHTAWLKELKIV